MTSVVITKLIGRCRQGDSEALGELYTLYAKRMRGVCRRYLSDKQAINDVLHDSFVIIFTSFDKLRDDSKAEAWMMSITRNVAAKYTEYQKTHQNVAIDDTDNNEFLIEDAFPKEAKEISLTEMMDLVDKLPEGYGKIFRLAVFEGLSHKEIAAVLNIDPHSSSSQLARAKQLLRKIIQQYWAVLLLLIPVAFYFLRKEDSVADSENPIVVNQSETPTIQPTEQPQQPTIVMQQPTQQTAPTARPQQSAGGYMNKSAISDTMQTEVAQETPSPDTLLHNGQDFDTIQPIQKIVETPYYNPTNVFPEKDIHNSTSAQLWAMKFAYAGSYDEQQASSSIVGHIIPEGQGYSPGSGENNYDTVRYTSHHYMPIVLTLSAHCDLNKRFGVETGISYIRLVSDFEKDSSQIISREPLQTIHYVGIPVKGIYNVLTVTKLSLYGNLGVTMEIPIHSTFNKNGILHNTNESLDTANIRVPLQWSLSTGLGLQYSITPNIGIFAEPSIRYYIPTTGKLETYCTEHPFTFSLPLGIRFTW